MSRANRNSAGWVGAVAMAVALVANMAAAAPLSVMDRGAVMPVPSAASLVRFYPSQLGSTPIGAVEDQEVWLAKVQGLMAGAPTLLQQSLLMSQTKQEFMANVALLQQMQKGMLEQGGLNLRTQAKNALLTPKLGSQTSSDLVYTTLEPCRIMDTRAASGASGVQGPIAGGSLKHIPSYITTGSNWGQYGQPLPLSDCGLNSTVGNYIWATAIVITILNPNFDAFLGVGDVNDLNTTLSTVALNYTHGQGLSTLYIVPQINIGDIYFAMPAGLSANLIFDVVGYFAVSQATALDCTIASSAVTAVANNVWTAIDASCPAGYSASGGGFDTTEGTLGYPGVWTTHLPISSTTWRTWVDNQTGANRNIQTFVQCCRVPGR
jgi:hypothetical protein